MVICLCHKTRLSGLGILIAGRFKYVLMHGERMRWRNFVRRYEFTAQHDEGDYPEDD